MPLISLLGSSLPAQADRFVSHLVPPLLPPPLPPPACSPPLGACVLVDDGERACDDLLLCPAGRKSALRYCLHQAAERWCLHGVHLPMFSCWHGQLCVGDVCSCRVAMTWWNLLNLSRLGRQPRTQTRRSRMLRGAPFVAIPSQSVVCWASEYSLYDKKP